VKKSNNFSGCGRKLLLRQTCSTLAAIMRVILCILFLLVFQCVSGQIPPIQSNTSWKDSTTSFLVKVLNNQYDFLLGYKIESFWWSNTQVYKVLAYKNSHWQAIQIVSTKNKKDRVKTEISKWNFSSDSAFKLINGLSALHFWTLDHDLLNQEGVPISDSTVRKLQIADGVNYKFEILTKEGYRIIQSYEPETYLKEFPKMTIRKIFIDGRELFLNTWNNSRM
jgi:hypothetical protein